MKVSSPPLTNDEPSSVAMQLSSPSPKRLYALPGDMLESEDHKRALAVAAAAAARRKRRKVLVRRSLQNRQVRKNRCYIYFVLFVHLG